MSTHIATVLAQFSISARAPARRAWSQERHPVWQRYVQERLGGKYSVEVLEEGLTEQEAEERESSLIAQLGERLVNWMNPGRGFDYEAIQKYHELRGVNLILVASTLALEASDPDLAIARYRKALDNLRVYENLVLERGLVAELTAPKAGDLNILDRLTLCLCRAGPPADALAETERYCAEFPGARSTSAGQRVLKRVTRDSVLQISGKRKPSGAKAGQNARHPADHVTAAKESDKPRPLNVAVPKDPVDRNIDGRKLEGAGLVDNAIEFYQANVAEGFEGNFPYERLASIFRRRGDLGAEIAVLERALEVFTALLQRSPRLDVAPKLARFTARLGRAQQLAERQKARPRSPGKPL